MSATWEIREGDALARLREMPDESVQACITSPPYFGLRDYGVAGQIGLERSPDEYAAVLVEVFREVRRVLRTDGTLWLNLGDSYNADGRKGRAFMGEGKNNGYSAWVNKTAAGTKPKDLLGIPWLVAFALRADGWYLRSDIIWSKPNAMPESVTDRPTSAHEHVFLLAKSARYYWDADAIREEGAGRVDRSPQSTGRIAGGTGSFATAGRWLAEEYAGRNRRNVWTVATQPFTGWELGARRVRVAADDADDDTMRIASPGCPVHAGLPARAPMARCDERAAGLAPRNPDSSGPAQALLDGFAPTDPSRVPDPGPDSSGSHRPSHSDAAIPSSTESRRMDHGPETSPACTPSVETGSRTDDMSAPPASSAQHPDTLDRSSGEDGLDDPRQSGTRDRTARRPSQRGASACTCEHYKVEQTDHFATFPPKLIEPCVLAGSAERACGVCEAPWQRVVETDYVEGRRSGPGNRAALGDVSASSVFRTGLEPRSRTSGFVASCEHDDPTGHSLILDPFTGAGTTGLVALRHNRSFLGIELNPAYAEMARERIRRDAPLLNTMAEAGEPA